MGSLREDYLWQFQRVKFHVREEDKEELMKLYLRWLPQNVQIAEKVNYLIKYVLLADITMSVKLLPWKAHKS